MLSSLARTGTLLTLLFFAACAPTTRDPAVPRVERDMITRQMVEESRATNAYEVVQALRSNWLLPRGVDSFNTPGQVQAYYNDTRLGGVDELSGISLNEIGYIQYFDGNEASARWGLDHGHGVIFVGTLPPQ